MGRRRTRLVPADCIEIFEIRMALYFGPDGRRHVEAGVSDPDDADLESLDLIELRGAIDLGRDLLLRWYSPVEED